MTSEDVSFCLAHVGKPWVSGASGPDAFDCWGLIQYVYKERRGLILPEFVGIDRMGLLEVSREMLRQVADTWQPIDSPLHLCGVAMSANRRAHHVGLWIQGTEGGAVFHSIQGKGVLVQSLQSLKMSGLQNITFFKHQSS